MGTVLCDLAVLDLVIDCCADAANCWGTREAGPMFSNTHSCSLRCQHTCTLQLPAHTPSWSVPHARCLPEAPSAPPGSGS
jgi:hypothetical protein